MPKEGQFSPPANPFAHLNTFVCFFCLGCCPPVVALGGGLPNAEDGDPRRLHQPIRQVVAPVVVLMLQHSRAVTHTFPARTNCKQGVHRITSFVFNSRVLCQKRQGCTQRSSSHQGLIYDNTLRAPFNFKRDTE
eukprot:430081-Prorocentrum_minimum.AAC.1